MNEQKTGGLLPHGRVFAAAGGGEADLCRPRAVVYFLRDYACVLTLYELELLTQREQAFRQKGYQIVAVVDSSREMLCRQLEQQRKTYPFLLACPAQDVYGLYGVGCAENADALGDERTLRRVAQAKAAGFAHGADSGDPLRLPAVFVSDEACRIRYCHYGKAGADIPEADELLALL